MAEFSLDEIEMTVSQLASNRHEWRIYTGDPVMVAKFTRLGYPVVREYDDGIGKLFIIPANLITFRQTPTEAQMAARRAQGARLRSHSAQHTLEENAENSTITPR